MAINKRPPDSGDDNGPRRRSPYRPQPPVKVSPRIARQTHRLNARGQRVKKLSEVLMHDLRGIVENPVFYFKKNVLPDIPGVDLFQLSEALAKQMESEGTSIVEGRWVGFKSDPTDMRAHEDNVFANLKDIWETILVKSDMLEPLKSLKRKRLVKLTARPRNHGKGARSSRARPDLLFELETPRVVLSAAAKLTFGRYLFGNIAAFVEAKKHLTRASRYQVRL